MPDFSLENNAKGKGYIRICGVDEAGRGPLAGPVCAAAVILPETVDLPGLDDSKKLTEQKREQLYDKIKEQAVAYCIAFGTLQEIESLNILQATFLAMNRAIDGLSVPADYALIDGNLLPKGLTIPGEPAVKGDARSMSIAAASILAKVTRDRLLCTYETQYPGYGFSAHKGYGTKAHVEAIRRLGPCEVHRLSFLKKIL